ncbi:MAG: FliM/FliN family flagellar motor switch protein [Labilithrix sp.]|nr:FliM/FliN family flagellar motor switch protein [Labilithrix sp.]
MNEAQGLVKLALAGERARRACDLLSSEARALEGAVMRSLPHLARRKIAVSAEPARSVLESEILGDVARPHHLTPLRVGPSSALGAIILDANLVAHGLDGMLGAGRGDVPRLDPRGLSAAQTALASRLARSLVAAFDEVFGALGAPLEIASGGADGQPASVLVACTVTVGAGESQGKVVLLVPAAAIDGDLARSDDGARVPAAERRAEVSEVELELVAELGSVSVSLARLASLRVGDLLTLPLAVDAPVKLRVGDRRLFQGTPTTRGSHIALELVGHAA